jgi:hypothetical protein
MSKRIRKKRLSLQDKAELAMKEAIKEVVARHKKSGRPLTTWKDGKVVRVSADSIK